jgi:hypothetical protein
MSAVSAHSGVRALAGIALILAVILALAGCTVNVVIPATPRAAPAAPAAPKPGRNPCEVVICGLHPSRIV